MPGERSRTKPVDDRGRPIELNAVFRRADSGPRDDPQLADLRMRALMSAAPRRSVLRFFVLVLAFGAISGLSAALLPRWTPGLPAWSVPGLIGLTCLVYFTVRSRGAVRRNASPVIGLFLFEGRCPGCGYTLDGATLETDGCMVCPECGAAWNAARIRASSQTPEAIKQHRRRLFAPTSRERWLPGVRINLGMRDARNRVVWIPDPRLRRADAQTLERIGPARVESLRRHIGWRQRTRGLFLSIGMIPAFLTFARMLFNHRTTGSSSMSVMISMTLFLASLLMVLLLGTLVVSLLFGENGLNPKAVARQFLRLDLCPQCLGDLKDVPQDPGDHARVCPCCAAAWNPPGTS